MSALPSMDSQKIECDSNGVVSIKPLPVLAYAVAGAIGLFSLVPISRGEFLLGIIGIITAAFVMVQAGSRMGGTLEFDPNTRVFKILSNSKSIAISFDEIAGFGFSTQKESGNFTREEIIVILKDDRAIQIGVITDANEKKREQKVSSLIKFLYGITGIVPKIDQNNLSL